ncbi:protein C9orf135-like, partial [Sceloporus undulatus]|uniref:protein C9orf135-like n=1 Tax=Sceloporus undulatus TaxID=8520 RepID=UPI001C4C789D
MSCNSGFKKWITTNQDFLSQPYRIKDYEELEIHKSMLDKDNFEIAVTDRETGLPESGFGAVLPRHSPHRFAMLVFEEFWKRTWKHYCLDYSIQN